MATRPMNVQTPGASPGPSAPDDSNEDVISAAGDIATPKPQGDLPPDLQAIVAAEVARQVGKQRAANKQAVGKGGEAPMPYAQAEAKMAAMGPAERRTMRPILTDQGYLVSPEYGASTRATLE